MIGSSGPPRRAIGVIAPSANVVVEWTAINVMRAFPDVGLHFTRTPMRGTIDPHPEGYEIESMLGAAALLADAAPNVILWAGSKGVLVGLEREEALCAEIERETSVQATTPSLALGDLVVRRRWRRAVLVTPYTTPYQQRLIDGLARMEIACVAERHAGVANNLDYAAIEPEHIRRMAREAVRDAAATPDLVLAWCTNFASAVVAGDLERELRLPVIDATLIGVRQALSTLRVDASPASAWGSLFTARLDSGIDYEIADRQRQHI